MATRRSLQAARRSATTTPAMGHGAAAKVSAGAWRRIVGRRLRGRAVDAAVLAGLTLAAAAFFWPVLSGRAWLPHGGGDLASFLFPMYRFAAASLHSGQIPLWNPYQYAGAPFIADNQSGLFYPVNLILFLAWPGFSYFALECLVVLHVWWAGVGMYASLRFWDPSKPVPRTAAICGALAFMFSDVFVTHVGNLNLIAVASWLPLALVALHRAVDLTDARRELGRPTPYPPAPALQAGAGEADGGRTGLGRDGRNGRDGGDGGNGGNSTTVRRWRWALASGVALGVGALAGHGQVSFLVGAFVGLYALYRVAADRRLTALPLAGVAATVAIGLAAVSVVPAIALRVDTIRSEFSYEQSVAYSLPPRGVVGLVAPGFYGRGARDFWGRWDRVETGYAGVATLLLATIALAKADRRRKVFFALAGGLAMLLTLGSHTPLHRWLVGPLVLPFQAPARFVLLTDFCLAFLAAQGMAYLVRDGRPALGRLTIALTSVTVLTVAGLVLLGRQLAVMHPERIGQMSSAIAELAVLAGLGLLLLVLLERGRVSPALFGALMVLLLAVDLIALGGQVEIDDADPSAGFRHPVAIAYLQADGGLQRIDAATAVWQPGAAQMLGLHSIGGVYNPLQLGLYKYYMDGLEYRGSTPYNLLSTKYVVAAKGEPPSDREFIVPVFTADPTVDIYLNRHALPRVALLYEARIEPDDAAAYDLLRDPDFDAGRTIVLSAGESLPTGTAGTAGTASTASTASVDTYRLNDVIIRVATARAAYLLLTDIYHPDWRATLDGRPVEIVRADFAFRAVRVPAGEHEVRMWFAPPSWRLGIIVSAMTAASLLVVFLARRG